MSVKPVAVVVALVASTAACIASPDEGDTAPTSTTHDALAVAGPDAPMPLDHPTPMPELLMSWPWARGFGSFYDPNRDPDEWEHNPMSLGGCYVTYLRIFDPGRGPIEVPITVCP